MDRVMRLGIVLLALAGCASVDADDRVIVDAAVPVVYTRLTYTLLGGLIHPQWSTHSGSASALPAAQVMARELPVTLDETAFVPQTIPVARSDESVVLRIESGAHYLRGVFMRITCFCQPSHP
jgi:hypothetical protein